MVVAALVVLGGSRAAITATPAEIGQWSAPVSWPLVAVHMSLEPTGQVFTLDGFDAGPNSERLWDPATGIFTPVPYGRNLFCAGHIQLADGRTLLVGGHINANEGLADTTIFNPVTRTYFRGPDMTVGRWYPTATELPDGRVLTLGGDNIVQDRPGADPPLSDASVNSLPEVYNPTTNTWQDLDAARITSPLYPFMFVLSDGRVFDAGPDKITRILNPANWTWSTVGTSQFDGHSAVMYRPNKIMKSGAWADPDFNGALTYNAHGRTAVIDMSAPTPAWRETAPMANGRSYHNMTLLPDGTVLASGGGSKSDGRDIANSVFPAEIWNPDTETWTTVASLQNGRLYHSTALLLPDGRVLMAGGGQLPGSIAVNQTNAEIYSPPYLFKGPRPTMSAVPSAASYGSSFDVTTPNAASISKVSLIRSPSVTHAFDQNQRFQFLNFTIGAGKVTVTAPANANLAPPGDYLLFLVDSNGVPSTGSFVRISAGADTTPPTAPTGLAATGTPAQVALTWTAATDNVGISRYNVHRSTTAGFTPNTGNRIAQPTTTSYTDTGLATGTYYYKVTAEDTAGNVGPASNEANATVPPGPGPPAGLVAAWGFDEGFGTTTVDRSANANTGTLSNATWATTGKFGNALSFNGSSASVNVPDSNSLDLTTGMTIEGWVQPATGGGFRTLIVKERPGDLVYGLYSSSDTNRPQSQVTISPPAATPRRHGRDPERGLDAPRRDLRRHHTTSLRQRHAGLIGGRRGLDHDLDFRAEDRRQLDLGRMVQRPDRRGPGLQPRAQRGGDPDRHDHGDQLTRRCSSRRAGHADRDGRPRPGQPQLGSGERQRRRRSLQRPPLDHGGLHAERPATGSRSRPGRATPTPGSPPAPTSTRSLPRTLSATSGLPATRRAGPRPPTRRRRQHRRPSWRSARPDRSRSRGAPRRTQAASPATTSIARRRRASRRAPATGSRSPPARATPTPGSRAARTTTRSPRKTPRGTSGPPPTRRTRRCRPDRRRVWSRRTGSMRVRGRPRSISPATATWARSRTRPGRPPASSATRSPSTAPTPPSRSPTPTRST